MSAGLTRMSANLVVVQDTNGVDTGVNAWVHPVAVGATNGWSKDATNSGLYDTTVNRRYVRGKGTVADEVTGIEYSYVGADANVSGAVGWGKPRLSGNRSLLVVFRSNSL
jgi:hypothetical protein